MKDKKISLAFFGGICSGKSSVINFILNECVPNNI